MYSSMLSVLRASTLAFASLIFFFLSLEWKLMVCSLLCFLCFLSALFPAFRFSLTAAASCRNCLLVCKTLSFA